MRSNKELCGNDLVYKCLKKISKQIKKVLSFQEIIMNLQKFWSKFGCIILQPYDIEVGAGTFHPATTLRSLGDKTMEGSICSAI